MADLNNPRLVLPPESQDGRQINVATGAISPATAVPLFSSGDTSLQKRGQGLGLPSDRFYYVTFEATNTGAVDLVLRVTYGGTNGKDILCKTVPAFETVIVFQRRRVRGLNLGGYETTGSGALNVYVEVEEVAP